MNDSCPGYTILFDLLWIVKVCKQYLNEGNSFFWLSRSLCCPKTNIGVRVIRTNPTIATAHDDKTGTRRGTIKLAIRRNSQRASISHSSTLQSTTSSHTRLFTLSGWKARHRLNDKSWYQKLDSLGSFCPRIKYTFMPLKVVQLLFTLMACLGHQKCQH